MEIFECCEILHHKYASILILLYNCCFSHKKHKKHKKSSHSGDQETSVVDEDSLRHGKSLCYVINKSYYGRSVYMKLYSP